ncbi:MAG: hypothetical protein V4677_10395 [Bacteroidota bacterium]
MKNLFIVLFVFASACVFCFTRSYPNLSVAAKGSDKGNSFICQTNNPISNGNTSYNKPVKKDNAKLSSFITH